MKIVTLVEPGGKARSIKAEDLRADTLRRIVVENADRDSRLMTDERPAYRHIGDHFTGGHETVNHGEEERVRGDAHVNTTERFFSVFKRGMRGIYQHCSERHLHRYLAEFDFRYNNRVKLGVDDVERSTRAVKGIVGKRLTYRTTDRQTGEAKVP
jgi:hypothetical protein